MFTVVETIITWQQLAPEGIVISCHRGISKAAYIIYNNVLKRFYRISELDVFEVK